MAKKPVDSGIDPDDPDLEQDAPRRSVSVPAGLPQTLAPGATVPEEGDHIDDGREWYELDQDVIVQGRDCKKGGKLRLTPEEAEALKNAGVRFVGDEEPTPEDLQAKHEEAAEALRTEARDRPLRNEKERLEKRREELDKEEKALDEQEANMMEPIAVSALRPLED